MSFENRVAKLDWEYALPESLLLSQAKMADGNQIRLRFQFSGNETKYDPLTHF